MQAVCLYHKTHFYLSGCTLKPHNFYKSCSALLPLLFLFCASSGCLFFQIIIFLAWSFALYSFFIWCGVVSFACSLLKLNTMHFYFFMVHLTGAFFLFWCKSSLTLFNISSAHNINLFMPV